MTLNRLDLPQRRLQGEQGVCGVKVLVRANEGTPPHETRGPVTPTRVCPPRPPVPSPKMAAITWGRHLATLPTHRQHQTAPAGPKVP